MVNIYKLKLTSLQQEVLRALYQNYGKPINAHRLSKLLLVSQPAISKALKILEENHLINVDKDKDSGRLSIEINDQSFEIKGLKRADNLKQLYESGLVSFLYENLAGATIILFGTYSYGDDAINSDIDIAIIGTKEKKLNLEKFEKILKREVILNYYDSFNNIKNKQLLNNILNGITLGGHVSL